MVVASEPSASTRARAAARTLALAGRAEKDAALEQIARRIEASAATILAANGLDVAAARASGTPAALLDRLTLDHDRLAALAQAARSVADSPTRSARS